MLPGKMNEMKDTLDKKLCEDFPLTFRDRHADMRSTAMCWGFPNSGWEPLIRRAAEKIEPIIQKFVDEGGEKDGHRLTSTQIKEKFGTLRWYFSYSHPDIDAIIKEAEKESTRTCEDCGEEGQERGGGYILTQCDDCYRNQIELQTRAYLFAEVLRELKKKGHLDAVAALEAWKKEKEEKENEQDNETPQGS